MEAVFIKLVNMSISASYMVIIIALLRLMLKKAPKWIWGILWAMVAIRLLIPFSVESVLSLMPTGEPVSPEVFQVSAPVLPADRPVAEPIPVGTSPVWSGEAEKPSMTPVTKPVAVPEQPVEEGTEVRIGWIAAVVWAVGLSGMLLYALISYLRVRRKVREGVPFKDNCYLCDHIGTPFILGIIRPRIYLPSDMDEGDHDYVIAHEMAHLKRKDHLWKPFGFLLLSVYWFNPVIWLGYILLCRDIELACDERVIKELGSEQKKPYADALINCSVSRRFISACPLAFGEGNVERRIKSVLNYKKPAFWVILLSIVVCIAVAVTLLTDPKKEPEEPEEVVDEIAEMWKKEDPAAYFKARSDIALQRLLLGDGAADLFFMELRYAEEYGVREYLLAKACSEITGIGYSEPANTWKTADEFIAIYESQHFISPHKFLMTDDSNDINGAAVFSNLIWKLSGGTETFENETYEEELMNKGTIIMDGISQERKITMMYFQEAIGYRILLPDGTVFDDGIRDENDSEPSRMKLNPLGAEFTVPAKPGEYIYEVMINAETTFGVELKSEDAYGVITYGFRVVRNGERNEYDDALDALYAYCSNRGDMEASFVMETDIVGPGETLRYYVFAFHETKQFFAVSEQDQTVVELGAGKEMCFYNKLELADTQKYDLDGDGVKEQCILLVFPDGGKYNGMDTYIVAVCRDNKLLCYESFDAKKYTVSLQLDDDGKLGVRAEDSFTSDVHVFDLNLTLDEITLQGSQSTNANQTSGAAGKHITVDGVDISIDEINNQIKSTFNKDLFYGGFYTDSKDITLNAELILNKTLEYDLYYNPDQYTQLTPKIYIVITNLTHHRSTAEEPLLYMFGIDVTKHGLRSDFSRMGAVSKSSAIELDNPFSLYMGSYSMCINEITQPTHEKMSDEWKRKAESAIQLYMDDNVTHAIDENDLAPGKYTVYIEGFSKSDSDSTVVFVHEDGRVYMAEYLSLHEIYDGELANLNRLYLVEWAEKETFQMYLSRLRLNPALEMEYCVDAVEGDLFAPGEKKSLIDTFTVEKNGKQYTYRVYRIKTDTSVEDYVVSEDGKEVLELGETAYDTTFGGLFMMPPYTIIDEIEYDIDGDGIKERAVLYTGHACRGMAANVSFWEGNRLQYTGEQQALGNFAEKALFIDDAGNLTIMAEDWETSEPRPYSVEWLSGHIIIQKKDGIPDTRYLVESSAENQISIEIPIFEDGGAINQTILEYPMQWLYEVTGQTFDYGVSEYGLNGNDEYAVYLGIVKHRITYVSDDLISIVFEGYLNQKTAAHPVGVFFTLNINRKTGERIWLKDIYTVDEAFYDIFLKYAREQLPQELTQLISVEELFSKDFFLSGMDTEGYWAYFTDTGVGISCPVPHVAGDHMEIEIPYSALQ